MRSGQVSGRWGFKPWMDGDQQRRDRRPMSATQRRRCRRDDRRRHHGGNAGRAKIADHDPRLCDAVIGGDSDLRDRKPRRNRVIGARSIVGDTDKKVNQRKDRQHRATKARLPDRHILIARRIHFARIANRQTEHYYKPVTLCVFGARKRDKLPSRQLPARLLHAGSLSRPPSSANSATARIRGPHVRLPRCCRIIRHVERSGSNHG
ncbi:hypothetical protein BH11PSE4_BH11PSE4_37420 [soil metagenome]